MYYIDNLAVEILNLTAMVQPTMGLWCTVLQHPRISYGGYPRQTPPVLNAVPFS